MNVAVADPRPSPTFGRFVPQAIMLAVVVHVLLVFLWQLDLTKEGGGGGQVVGRMSVSLGGTGAAGTASEVPVEAPTPSPAAEPVVETQLPEPEPVAEIAPPPPPPPVVERPRRRAVVTPPVRREVRPEPQVRQRAPQQPVAAPPAPAPEPSTATRRGEEGDGRPVGDTTAGTPTRGEGMPSLSAGRGNGETGQINPELAYLSIVRSQIAQNRIYPAAARRRRAEGVASVRIEINASGNVVSAVLVQESGHFQLDRAAKRMVDKAAPFPPPPTTPFHATIPIEFELR